MSSFGKGITRVIPPHTGNIKFNIAMEIDINTDNIIIHATCPYNRHDAKYLIDDLGDTSINSALFTAGKHALKRMLEREYKNFHEVLLSDFKMTESDESPPTLDVDAYGKPVGIKRPAKAVK